MWEFETTGYIRDLYFKIIDLVVEVRVECGWRVVRSYHWDWLRLKNAYRHFKVFFFFQRKGGCPSLKYVYFCTFRMVCVCVCGVTNISLLMN